MLDQQPVRALAPFPVVGHPDQHEAALQALALERKLEIALRQSLLRGLLAFRLPVAAVPKHDRAATILALRDRPFEIAVVERMIFHLDGEALVMRIERGAAGHRPGFEDAVELKTKIVVQPGRVMLLDDEAAAFRWLDRLLAAGLLRLLENRAWPCMS